MLKGKSIKQIPCLIQPHPNLSPSHSEKPSPCVDCSTQVLGLGRTTIPSSDIYYQQLARPRHKNLVGQRTAGCVIGIAVQERWQDKGRGESQGFQLSVHTAPSVTCPDSWLGLNCWFIDAKEVGRLLKTKLTKQIFCTNKQIDWMLETVHHYCEKNQRLFCNCNCAVQFMKLSKTLKSYSFKSNWRIK